MLLRPYQQDAFNAIKADIDKPGACLCVIPTAGGKSHIIAQVATLKFPVLILQPSRELLDQNRAKLALIVPKEDIGTYSASFNERTIRKFTFATIQSVYKKPELFQHIKLVICDEAHGIVLQQLGSMYMEFLTAIGMPKIIGMTATCYRLENGYYYNGMGNLEMATMLKLLNRMRHKSQKEMFWKRIVYSISHAELLRQGYLSPLEYIHEPLLPYKEIPVNKSHSDYNLEAYSEAIIGKEALILSTLSEAQKRYKSLLVFCATTEQAEKLKNTLIGSEVVTALTPNKERVKIIEGFKKGTIQTVFNVGCLTTGFDKPEIDCIVLLRPTRSPILYQQMLGRGTRIAERKDKCTIIDLTSTCKALGRIETFELYRNAKGLWDLKTERHETWHDRVLFTRLV